MKIVHAVYSLEMGGAEMLVAQLCRIQRSNGHVVSVCAYSALGVVGEALRAEGFEVHILGVAHPAITMWRYSRLFRRIRPDVVHCHNPAPTLQAALPARLSGARSVVSTRHSLVAPPYHRSAEIKFSLMARFCDWVVGICETTCVNLRGAPLASGQKIVRVYNGTAAVDRPSSTPLQKHGFTVVFIGRLAEIKDLGTLIRAVALARNQLPALQAWIVGDGPVRSHLEALTAELGATQNVCFWGQQMDTPQFFAAADAFVMTSVSEGLPMSLLQAMSLGIPAIVTAVGGMAEVVESAGSGLLVPVGDPEALCAAIVRLAGDPELRSLFANRARAAYEAQFTLERMDAGYMELYRRPR